MYYTLRTTYVKHTERDAAILSRIQWVFKRLKNNNYNNYKANTKHAATTTMLHKADGLLLSKFDEQHFLLSFEYKQEKMWKCSSVLIKALWCEGSAKSAMFFTPVGVSCCSGLPGWPVSLRIVWYNTQARFPSLVYAGSSETTCKQFLSLNLFWVLSINEGWTVLKLTLLSLCL